MTEVQSAHEWRSKYLTPQFRARLNWDHYCPIPLPARISNPGQIVFNKQRMFEKKKLRTVLRSHHVSSKCRTSFASALECCGTNTIAPTQFLLQAPEPPCFSYLEEGTLSPSGQDRLVSLRNRIGSAFRGASSRTKFRSRYCTSPTCPNTFSLLCGPM